jgi:cytochrome P450
LIDNGAVMADEILDFPFETRFTGQPSPVAGRLRDERPICKVRLPNGAFAWFVLRYVEVQQVMSDPRFSRMIRHTNTRYAKEEGGTSSDGPVDLTENALLTGRTLSMDGPEHSALRRLLGQAFTAQHVKALLPQIRQVTDDLLDDLAAAAQPADLMRYLAFPLPMQIICTALGLPPEDRATFSAWSKTVLGHHSVSHYTPEEIATARREMSDYMMRMITRKRREPGNDILSAMIAAEVEGDRLTDLEIVTLTRAMLVAGHETTVSMIGIGLWRLFMHPEQLAALRADLGLVETAVEEILRYQPQGHFAFPQIATEDVTLAGVDIREGELVFAPSYSANRDERRFADAEEFDVCRRPNPHLTFGHGSHFCLGAPLARAELQVAYTRLFERFPKLAPAIPPEQMLWRERELVGNLKELLVTW